MQNNIIELEFIFTRHGLSCANILSAVNMSNIQGDITPDAVLSDYGIYEAQLLNLKLKQDNIKPDIVLCSKLKRAIETALYAYRDIVHNVFPVPFLSEVRDPTRNGADYDNIPDHTNNIKEYFSKNHELGLNSRVNFELLDYFEANLPIDRGISLDQMNRPDFAYFIEYVIPYVINDIKIKLPDRFRQNKKLVIAVVSHHYFLKDHLNISVEKIYDNQINRILVDDNYNLEQKNNIINAYKERKTMDQFANYANVETWIENAVINFGNINNKHVTYNPTRLRKIYVGNGELNAINNDDNQSIINDKINYLYDGTNGKKLNITNQKIYDRCEYHPKFKNIDFKNRVLKPEYTHPHNEIIEISNIPEPQAIYIPETQHKSLQTAGFNTQSIYYKKYLKYKKKYMNIK